MPPNAPPADRAVYAASAALDKLLSQAQAFRAGLAGVRLPPDAETALAYGDDLIAILQGKLNDAAGIVNAAMERIQEAEEVAYARAHGVLALASTEAAIDRDFNRWTNALAANDDRARAAVL